MESKIYLNRHFPDRLYLSEIKLLPIHRIKSYYSKHRKLIGKINHDTYPYSDSDKHYNGEFGTNAEKQIKEYFSSIADLIKEMEAKDA